jgi:hypothetical protein
MKIFPWPVLTDDTEGDYPNQVIETSNLVCSSDGVGLTIDWTPTTTCPYLNALLDKGDAKWLIELQCHRTLFIERYNHSCGHLNILVSPEDVRGTLHFRAYITATKQLSIEPTGVNEQLAGKYDLLEGDQLGWYETTFETDPEFAKNPGLRSLFTFREADEDESGTYYKLTETGDRFVIILSKSTYVKYATSRSARTDVKLASTTLLILPALVETLGMLKEKSSENSDGQTLKAEDIEEAPLRRLALLLRHRLSLEPHQVDDCSSIAVQLIQGKSDLLADCLSTLND